MRTASIIPNLQLPMKAFEITPQTCDNVLIVCATVNAKSTK